MGKTIYGKAPRVSPLEHRLVRYSTSNDNNNQLVLITTRTDDRGFVAHAFAVQKDPDKACLLYRFDVGFLENYDSAVRVACKLLAGKLRLASAFLDSKFIIEGESN